MEENLAMITKKLWKTIRVVYFMLRKGMISSKGNFLADLSTLIKRGKIAGKAAFHHLVFHHHHHRRRAHHHSSPLPPFDRAAMAAAMEIVFRSAGASPALPGFGASPMMVRQLRITDSPFPLEVDAGKDDGHVDEAAEEFIVKFYKDLKMQNYKYLGSS